jgi:hypothetical protein
VLYKKYFDIINSHPTQQDYDHVDAAPTIQNMISVYRKGQQTILEGVFENIAKRYAYCLHSVRSISVHSLHGLNGEVIELYERGDIDVETLITCSLMVLARQDDSAMSRIQAEVIDFGT